MRYIICIAIVLQVLSVVAHGGSDVVNVQVVRDMISRTVPELASKVDLQVISPSDGGFDRYEIETPTIDRVTLRGSSSVALASALNRYLEYHCNVLISWAEDQLLLPSPLPRLLVVESFTRPVKWSYYQNVCTVSYTSVWWDWTRWEREIDWMALNGVNMPLAFTGQEKVWQLVFKAQFNLTDADLNEFFSGPAFLAWYRMGNIKGYGGPLPASFIDGQYELQVKILARMREFGMTPVLPAFAGHVPDALRAKFPNVNITASAPWNGFPETYSCVALLDPNEPLYQTIGAAMISKQTELYGTDHIYNADTFNENRPGSAEPTYLRDSAAAVFRSMTSADPQAIWLMQGWLFQDEDFWKPAQIAGLLSGVPDDRMIILDLYAENKPYWQETNNFYGKPFIWCMLHDFGGNIGLYGRMEAINQGPYQARLGSNHTMIGVGLTMEGTLQNYPVYSLMAEMAWRSEPVNLDDWIVGYATRRYAGMSDSLTHPAWRRILWTAYNTSNAYFRSVTKSMIEIRPGLHIDRTQFMPTELYYQPEELAQAWDMLVLASQTDSALAQLPSFQYDLIEIGRQVLSNIFLAQHAQLVAAYNQSDIVSLKQISDSMLQLILDSDELLATNQNFLLGRWIADARALGSTAAEADLFEFNARNQVTRWGPNGENNDYASKSWSGLLADYYHARWSLFSDSLLSAVSQGIPWDEQTFHAQCSVLEQKWQDDRTSFPTKAIGNTVAIAQSLHNKYRGSFSLGLE